MKQLTQQEKKATILILTIMLILGSLALFGVGLYFLADYSLHELNDRVYTALGTLFTFISPATIFGIIIKVFINKRHLKQIDAKLVESGIKPLTKENHADTVCLNELKRYFSYKDYEFKANKTKITITFTDKGAKDNYLQLVIAIGLFLEKVRKDLPKELYI